MNWPLMVVGLLALFVVFGGGLWPTAGASELS